MKVDQAGEGCHFLKVLWTGASRTLHVIQRAVGRGKDGNIPNVLLLRCVCVSLTRRMGAPAGDG